MFEGFYRGSKVSEKGMATGEAPSCLNVSRYTGEFMTLTLSPLTSLGVRTGPFVLVKSLISFSPHPMGISPLAGK